MRLATFLLASLALMAGECIVGPEVRAQGASRTFLASSSEQLTGTSGASSSPLTFAAWVKLDATADASVFAIHNGSTSGYGMRVRDAGAGDGVNAGMIFAGSCFNLTYDAYTVTPEVWAFVAVGWDGAGNTFTYFNGSYNTGTESCTDPSVSGLYIGSFGGTGSFYDGELSQVACWAAYLSQAELDELNQGIVPYMVDSANITGYWPIVGTSPELDLVGSANLTVSGTPTVNAGDGPPIWTP